MRIYRSKLILFTFISYAGSLFTKVVDSFYGGARAAGAVLKRVGSIFSGEDRSAVQKGDVVAKLSAGKGTQPLG